MRRPRRTGFDLAYLQCVPPDLQDEKSIAAYAARGYEGGTIHAATAAPAKTPSVNTVPAIISLVEWLSTRFSSPAITGPFRGACTVGSHSKFCPIRWRPTRMLLERPQP